MQPHLKSINPFTDYFVPLVGNLSITCLFSYRANDPSTPRDCNRSVFSENPRIQFVTISQRSRTNTGLHGRPQGVHPPRRIRHILVVVQPTRKPNRVRGLKTPCIRIVVPMPVVMQVGFRVVVLALKPQGVIDLLNQSANDVAV